MTDETRMRNGEGGHDPADEAGDAYWRVLHTRYRAANAERLSFEEAERRMAEEADDADEAPPLSEDQIARIVASVTQRTAADDPDAPHDPVPVVPMDAVPRAVRRGFPWAKAAAVLVAAGILFGIGGALQHRLWPDDRDPGTLGYREAVELLLDDSDTLQRRTVAAGRVFAFVRHGVEALRVVADQNSELSADARTRLRELRDMVGGVGPVPLDSIDDDVVLLARHLTDTQQPTSLRRRRVDEVATQAQYGIRAMNATRAADAASPPELSLTVETFLASLAAIIGS